MKITMSASNTCGDITSIEITRKEFAENSLTLIEDILELNDDKVYVLFNSDNEAEYDGEHTEFLITECSVSASEYLNKLSNELKFEHLLDLNIFSFENYKEALIFLTDLKEGL